MGVWNYFAIKEKAYDPHDLFEDYICKFCGKEFPLQVAGAQSIYAKSFTTLAFETLADHLCEHLPPRSESPAINRTRIEQIVREKLARKRFIGEAVEARICPECGSNIQMKPEPLLCEGSSHLVWCCTNESCGFKISVGSV